MKKHFFAVIFVLLFASITSAQFSEFDSAEIEEESFGAFPRDNSLNGDDAIMGNVNAPVTIVQFGGHEETFSRRFWAETFPTIKSEYIETGKVKFIFRDFPLEDLFPNDIISAEAAECVGEQGGDSAYFEMHNALYNTELPLDYNKINQAAQNLGYNIQNCLDSEQMFEEVFLDYVDAAFTYDLDGSPSFFVNGVLIVGAQPYEVFQQMIEEELMNSIDCFENSDCDDGNSGTDDVCIDSGTLESYCFNEEIIICYDDEDCGNEGFINEAMCAEDGNVRQDYQIWTCFNSGTTESFCDNHIFNKLVQECSDICSGAICLNNFEFKINSPDDISQSKKVYFNLTTSEEVEEISYINYADNSSPKFKKLCENCEEYGNTRKKPHSLKEGRNEIIFKVTRENGEIIEKNVSLMIDSKSPRINKIEPRRGFTSGSFEIHFTEQNPAIIKLRVWSHSDEVEEDVDFEDNCFESGTKTKCDVDIDLDEFNGETVSYSVELTDVVGREDETPTKQIIVDSQNPEINFFNYFIDDKKVEFTFEIEEENFESIQYIENLENNPRLRNLCTRLEDGICSVRKTFSYGEHHLNIFVWDKAGNFAEEEISFVI